MRAIPLGPQIPRRGNWFSRCLGLLVMRIIGWRFRGQFPDVPKAVIIAAPHTSNFDGLVAFGTVLGLGVGFSLMAKHSLFRWPFGILFRWLGAVPVDRNEPGDIVGQSVRRFQEREQLWLGVAPEGTRKGASEWKSGFYRIAVEAGVPIVMVAFDYRQRELVILGGFQPTGDWNADLPQIVERYRGMEPRRLDRLSGPLRALRDDQQSR